VKGSGSEDLVGTSKTRNELANMVGEMMAGKGPTVSDMAKRTN
jgi:hypothetical protein